MSNPKSKIQNPKSPRPAFTVMELLIVIMIIGILAAMSMMALAGAAEQAREQRTRAIISKIDQLIRERYEGYRTRSVPISRAAATPRVAAVNRLNALRELMRMELPDRRTDIVDYSSGTPVIQVSATGIQIASLQ